MAELITLSAGGDFFVLTRRDDRRWRRQAVVAFAMVADPASAPYVVPMTVAVDGEQVELADVGTILHATEFPRCQCTEPAPEVVDARFCTSCGSVVEP